MSRKPPTARSEGELFKMLERRLVSESGNGSTGVLISQVRDNAGFQAKRALDAVYLGFWPSRGLLLEGFEIKSSRSDWQTELKNPAKADVFMGKLDKFWVVAAHGEIVREGELPPDWGLLVARGENLVQVRAAGALRDLSPVAGKRPLPPEFDRGILVSMLRNASARAKTTPAEISEAEQRGFERGIDYAESGKRNHKTMYDDLHAKVRAFEDALGSSITGIGWPRAGPAEVGAKLKAVLAGEAELTTMEGRYRRIAADMASLLARAEEKLKEYGMERDSTPEERIAARVAPDADF